MICISIPANCIPDEEKHEVEVPIYVKGQFKKFTKNKFVSLVPDLVLDDAYDPDNFFVEMSGNEFIKLLERDILPKWASPQTLLEWSNASCTVSEDRKVTWVRVKDTQLQALHY